MQEFAKNYHMGDSIEGGPKEVETKQSELKYTVDSAGYRKYEMTCQECEQKFTRSIPNDWFNEDNEIKQRFLPEDFDAAKMQAVLDNPLCGSCQPKIKKKLDVFKAQNEQLKK